jgi:hypothetical protein
MPAMDALQLGMMLQQQESRATTTDEENAAYYGCSCDNRPAFWKHGCTTFGGLPFEEFSVAG